jgi:hypothetical protein
VTPPPANPKVARNLNLPAAAQSALGNLAANGFGVDYQQEMMLAALQQQMQYEWMLNEARKMALAAEQQQLSDVALIEKVNTEAREINSRVVSVLTGVTGNELGADREAWSKWWKEKQGYVYKPPGPRIKPTLLSSVPPAYIPRVGPPRVFGVGNPDPYCVIATHHVTRDPPGSHMRNYAFGGIGYSKYHVAGITEEWIGAPDACFAAGTTVASPEGPRPIELLRPGDSVLVRAGAQATSIAVVSYIDRAAETTTIRIRLGDDVIVATASHPFWCEGFGWIRAGDLKAGDKVRTRAGTSRVASLEPGEVQAVYNIALERHHAFFVGRSAALVHDGTPVDTDAEH